MCLDERGYTLTRRSRNLSCREPNKVLKPLLTRVETVLEYSMIFLNVLLLVKDPSHVAEVREHLSKAMRLSRREPGCLRFDVYHSHQELRRFVLIEHWASQEALDAHRLAEAYTTIYKTHVMPLIEREGHPATLLE